MSQIYFEKLKNKEIYWKYLYLMPCCVTVDTNLHIFQYKILINVIRQKKKNENEKLFKFKIVSLLFSSFCNLENETSIHHFYSCNQTKSLRFTELRNTFSTKYATECFLWFSRQENFEITNHLHLIFFKCYFICLNPNVKYKKSKSKERLKKNIIEIYSTEKQISLLKKDEQSLKKWHILENLLRQMKFNVKGAWVGRC